MVAAPRGEARGPVRQSKGETLKHTRTVLATAAAALAAAAPATASAASLHAKRVCGPAAKGAAACHAKVVTDAKGQPLATTGPSGYGPTDLQSAYNLAQAGSGAGHTIAIVDAYDLPTAQSDLNVYRSTFGLPPTTIRKVNQSGTTT